MTCSECEHILNVGPVVCLSCSAPAKRIRAWIDRQRLLGFITPEQAAFAEEMATDMERRR